jgi:hypothetical protein
MSCVAPASMYEITKYEEFDVTTASVRYTALDGTKVGWKRGRAVLEIGC